MPYQRKRYARKRAIRRRRKSPYTKKTVKTWTNLRAASSSSSKYNGILGTSKLVSLLYTPDNTTLSNLNPQLVYRMNSLWDPEYATGGHQPRGFDQMAQFFLRYDVISATINVVFYPASNEGPIFGYIYTNNDVSDVAPTSLTVTESHNSVIAYGQARLIAAADGYSSAGTGPIMCSKTVNIGKFASYGIHRDDYGAEVQMNPVKAVHCIIGMYDVFGAAVIGNVHVQITYNTRFSRPQKPIAS